MVPFAELFRYENGKLFWVKGPRQNKEAGCLITASRNRQRYRRVEVNGKSYYTHHIVWFLFKGYLPEAIDHIDGVGLNNAIENLREASPALNAKNRPKQRNTRSGHLGVFKLTSGRYKASIKVNGRSIHLGVFPDIESARRCRRDAEVLYGFSDNHNRPQPT